MAKLSAYGRTIVYQVRKVIPATSDMPPVTYMRALMSDGKILGKFSFEGSYQKHYGTWKVRGELKETSTPADWLNGYLSKGWEEVK